MKKILIIAIMLFCTSAYAASYHQNGQAQRVVYVITDNNGKPVSGQTVNLVVERSSDNTFLDFTDNTFKSNGWTTRIKAMSYDPVAENYFQVVSIDNGTIISGDYVVIVSNDDAVYGDRQAEVLNVDSVSNLIKIHR